MLVGDLILVSVDDHMVEPPSVFDNHIPDKYRDRAPRRVVDDGNVEFWVFEGERVPFIGLASAAGNLLEEYGIAPTRYDQMRPGCYDVHERVRDMNADGVLASLNFPAFPYSCGQLFARCKDRDLGLAVLQAYNDWAIDEWCGAYPGRFIPCAITPFWDPDAMAKEVRRVAAKGCHAVSFSENPEKLGHPSHHSPHWDPFWRACEEVGTVVCMHLGSSSSPIVTAKDAPVDVILSIGPMESLMAMTDLIFSPIFKKFPGVKVALSEGGIGWIPFALERMDYVYTHHHAWTGADFGGRLPSDVYRSNMMACFIDDVSGVEQRHRIGVETMTWESDYPHSDSNWPLSPEVVMNALNGLPDHEINQITHLNAIDAYQFDPFAHRPRESCTVGSLRAEASDVDTALRSFGRPTRSGDAAVDYANAYAAQSPDGE